MSLQGAPGGGGSSPGAERQSETLDEWARLAETHGCRIMIPSGAIAGLDGVKGAREGAISSVTMETRKPPRGLWGVHIRSDIVVAHPGVHP